MRGTITSTFVLLLVVSQMFLSQPLVSATIGDLAQVSPGKIPRPPPDKEDDHYLGNSSFQVKLEYPKSFILQETVGDLSFLISLDGSRRRIDIYIPPEFKVTPNTNNVWSNITNNYGNIGATKTSVSITNGTSKIERGNYSVRIFNVTAPSIVGRYFFKVFTDGTSIGAKNFPSVVVSADPNPAYVSGTIRYGGRLTTYNYGDPILLNATSGEGGKVCATGITAEGRIVVGQAFFNASAEGKYTLYGLAPGRYTLNATAAGYAPREHPYPILLKAGQSLDGVDIFLERSPSLSVMALSRRGGMPEPWGRVYTNRTLGGGPKNITFEILDSWNLTVTVRNETTDPAQTYCNFTYDGSRDLDDHIPQDRSGFVAGIKPGIYYVKGWINGYIQPSDLIVIFSQNEQNRRIDLLLEKTGTIKVTIHFRDSYQVQQSPIPFPGRLTVEAYDADDVLRARNSTLVVTANKNASVELTGFVDTRSDYGLPSGIYNITARFPGYIQPFEHRTTIGNGRSETSFYMLLLGRLDLTVFSVSWQRPFSLIPWRYPNSTITVEIRDVHGVEVYMSVRGRQPALKGRTPQNESAVKLENVTGLDDGTYSIHVFTYGYVQRQDVFFSVRRGEFADISVLMTIGVQIEVTLIFQKQRIISRIDTYDEYCWNVKDPKVPVRIEVYDSKAQFVAANITYMNSTNYVVTLAGFKSYYGSAAMRWVNYYDTTDGTAQKDGGLNPDWYTIKVYVPGYHQPTEPTIDVRTRGNVSLVLALHRMGHLQGEIHTFNTCYENYTRISWVSVDAIGEEMTLRTCTLDSAYELWMVPGSYLVVFSLPAYETRTLRIQISDGSDVTMNLQLLPLGMKLQSSAFPPSSLIIPRILRRNLGYSVPKCVSRVSRT